MIKALNQASKLEELYLVNMKVGPKTTAALHKLATNRGVKPNQPGLGICMRRCTLRITDFEEAFPSLLTREYPLL